MDKSAEIANANRELYNGSPTHSDDFQDFYNLPFVKSYVESVISDCVLKVKKTTTEPINALDIGTGYGHLLRYIAGFTDCKNIHAIDISEKNIRVAREEYPGAHFYVGDFIEDFEIDVKFDLLTAYSVLHHFHDYKSFIDKADSLLKTGGVIYIDHEPLPSIICKIITFVSKLRNHDNKNLFLAEYHQYYPLNPFEVKEYLIFRNFTVNLSFQNIALLGEVYNRLGINLYPYLPCSLKVKEVGVNDKFLSLWKHAFLSYRMVIIKK